MSVQPQTAAPQALSDSLRAHVQNERFSIVTSIRGLPLGVRDGLQSLFEGPLDIAEPGEEFQATGAASSPKLPPRRLIAAGCSAEHCLVHYERGGTVRTWHVALFYWTPAETRFEWGGSTSTALKTIEDVRDAVVAGKIKAPIKPW